MNKIYKLIACFLLLGANLQAQSPVLFNINGTPDDSYLSNTDGCSIESD